MLSGDAAAAHGQLVGCFKPWQCLCDHTAVYVHHIAADLAGKNILILAAMMSALYVLPRKHSAYIYGKGPVGHVTMTT